VFTPFKSAKRKSWKKQLAVVADSKISFFENDAAKANGKAELVLDVE